MKIAKYKTIIKHPLKPRTVVFLVRSNQVLLGLKKRGFGKGYFMGIGGKVEIGETNEKAALRETREEVLVEVTRMEYKGALNFYFPHIANESWNQQVHVFLASKWKGEPQETEEIKPKWFKTGSIPFSDMWDDARYWLIKAIEGVQIEAECMFDEHLKVVEYSEAKNKSRNY